MENPEPRLTLDDVLGLRYLDQWEWSPDGRFIVFIWDDGLAHDLWLADPGNGPPGAVRRVSSAKRAVTGFSWRPGRNRPLELAYVQDGEVWLAVEESPTPDGPPPGFASRPLLSAKAKHSSPAWSPDGRRLGYVYDEGLWVHDPDSARTRELAVPGRLRMGFGGASAAFAWSPEAGTYIAFDFTDESKTTQAAVVDPDAGDSGRVVWRSVGKDGATFIHWLDPTTAVYAVPRDGHLTSSSLP